MNKYERVNYLLKKLNEKDVKLNSLVRERRKLAQELVDFVEEEGIADYLHKRIYSDG